MRYIRPGFPIAVLIFCTAASANTDVRVTADGVPAVLSQLDLPDGVVAMAFSPDGSRLAYALDAAKEGFSEIFLVDAASEGSVQIQGMIRDLAFLDDSASLIGLNHHPAKKREGDTFLFSWGGEPKTRRIMRVPPSSNDLDRWPGGNAILLACRNEIRTLLPPDFRSGPLFSLPGDNFAVTSLGNSTYIVVGQNEGLFLIDLSVPSGRESMPVLASLGLPGRVAALADYPDGAEVLARLVDGRLYRAFFDPTGFEQAGTADHIAGLAKAAKGPVPAVHARVPVADPEPEPEPRAAPPLIEEPKPVIVAEIHETADVEPEAEEVEPEREPEAEDVEPDPPVVDVQPEPDVPEMEREPARQAPTRQLEGRIVGEIALVEGVVLLGPDNILREAARVQPDPDGSWGVDGLQPGRYRIQLDAGGGRVLVALPRFLMVDVGETPTRAPEIEAVREF